MSDSPWRRDKRLKPCPFCGENPYLYDEGDGCYSVTCQNFKCGTMPYTDILKGKCNAIKAWNRRSKNAR